MPLYDLTCEKAHKWSAYHGMGEEHGACPTCGGKAERNFTAGAPMLDGTSQGGWPRKNMSVPRVWRNGKPQVQEFTSQRDMDHYYNRTGRHTSRERFAEKSRLDPRGHVFVRG